MADYTEVFVGIDVAKVRNAIAIADGERGGEVRFLGEVDASEESMRRVVKTDRGPARSGSFLLRGRTDRLRAASADHVAWPPLHRRCAVADSKEAGRSGEDQPARCNCFGQAVARRRADCGMGAGRRPRGDA